MFKALDIWLPNYLRRPKRQAVDGVTHILIAVCDHFEPFHHAGLTVALDRVEQWKANYPRFQDFRDSDGLAPKHTFFYPVEQYHPAVLEGIAEICRPSGCEVEVHLHHNRDTAENLRSTLERAKQQLTSHGLLCRDESGAVRFAFIHGNWALDDSHPDGRSCGVRNELRILSESGCYADLTLPSAPSRTQTTTINSLYYATSTANPKSHNTGVPVKAGVGPSGTLLMVQGPLGLNWRRRKWGVLPRIDNGDLTGVNPPTIERLKVWLDLQIHVHGRPEWVFLKLYTHGALPENLEMLLGEPMHRFHADLAQFVSKRPAEYAFHYVSAREMVNILHAAEDQQSGPPSAYRDYRYRRPPVAIPNQPPQ